MVQTLDTNNSYAYTGRELDDTDLYYYRARYYDPTTQRFLSQDPIGFASGDFNFYRYVGNSPGNFVDPSGLWSVSADAYVGRGGGVTVGRGQNGWFMDYRVGVGLGGGLSLDLADQGMGMRGDGSYIGAYCDASAGFGIGYSASGSLGLTVGASNSYQGLKPLFKSNSGISVSKSKFGFTFGASAGVRGGFY